MVLKFAIASLDAIDLNDEKCVPVGPSGRLLLRCVADLSSACISPAEAAELCAAAERWGERAIMRPRDDGFEVERSEVDPFDALHCLPTELN